MSTKQSAKKRNKSKTRNRKNRPGKRNKPRSSLKMGSNARGTSQRQVGINRKLNLARKELSFLPSYDPKLGNGIRLKGADYLHTLITSPSGALPGSVLLDQFVAPGEFENTRLTQFAALFERYRVRSWTFWYIPNVPSTVSGTILSYPDYDVSDSLSPSLPLNEAMAHMGSQLFNVYSETPTQFDRVDPYTDLFTDAEGTDARLTYVGRLRYLAASNLAAGTTYGTVYMEYDIDFFIPQLQSSVISTAVPGRIFLKSTTTPTLASLSPNDQISLGCLDNGPTLGAGIVELGNGNIFTGTFTPDAAAPLSSLGNLPFTGGGITAAAQVFFKIVSNLDGSGHSNTLNTPYAAVYRSIVEAESDVPTVSFTGGSGHYQQQGGSLDTWKNTSGGVLPFGTLMGVFDNVRLIPYDKFASITY